MKHIHFIAIGGSAMHNLALALHHKGYKVTGSDDEIFEPSKSRLAQYNLLPEAQGWFPEKITTDLEAVILGMHARIDNPELMKAKELGLPIFSYPEYLYEQSKDKTRVVIGGSHGKTTTTSMILHVLQHNKIECDYMVGAQLEGFDTMVRLSQTAQFMVLEGDEYLSSPIDRRPKFHLYKPEIALITGIAWDHINVFPTFENYIEQFQKFVDTIVPGGYFIYNSEDVEVAKLGVKAPNSITAVAYKTPIYHIQGDEVLIEDEKGRTYPLQVFGRHNLQNMAGAIKVLQAMGLSDFQIYNGLKTFKGAAKRLQLIGKNSERNILVYKDFAHSPSKLKATTDAVKEMFGSRKLIACMELHTFSSLNKQFLAEYNGAMNLADVALVYFNPHTIEHKKLQQLSTNEVAEAFNRADLRVFTVAAEVQKTLEREIEDGAVVLLMTSGNFDGIDLDAYGQQLANG